MTFPNFAERIWTAIYGYLQLIILTVKVMKLPCKRAKSRFCACWPIAIGWVGLVFGHSKGILSQTWQPKMWGRCPMNLQEFMIANKQTADAKLESLNVWSQVTAFVHTYSPCWGTQAQPSQIEDLPSNIDKERNQDRSVRCSHEDSSLHTVDLHTSIIDLKRSP